MRTVTGLFDDYDDASAAVSELERAGVPSSDISIVGSNADRRHGEDETKAAEGAGTGAGIGALVGGAGGLL
ncbi:general stress protein, partial [Agrobacterium sp. DKPNP3]